MAFTAKLELRQSHSLVMTPQLQQAIKLLQLSNMELTAFVEAELERNPLLEREETDDAGAAAQGEASRRLRASSPTPSRRRTATPETLPTRAKARPPAARRANGSTFRPTTVAGEERISIPSRRTPFPTAKAYSAGALKESSWASLSQGPRLDGDDAPNLEAYVAEERTLKDHLSDQLALVFADPARRLIGHHLIDMTDEAGYLQGDLAALGELLGAPLDLVEETLSGDAGLRALRRVCPRLARMPHAAAEGAGPLRPRHGGADRASRPACRARPPCAEARLPRLRRGPLRHDPGGEAAEPQAWAQIWVEPVAADRARRAWCVLFPTEAGMSS